MSEDDDRSGPTPPEAAPPPDPEAPPEEAGPRRRWRKVLLRSAIALVVVAGLGLGAGTYYYDHVALPGPVALPQATTIYYADGTTPMARIGENRTTVPIDQIPVDVQHAVVAAQDESFYANGGVDYGGLVATAWNHAFGDGKRRGSTISQQYARQWADLEGVSYSRKARESVIATKLNKQYSKDQILAMYLNTVYFGRGAYGIEAAAQAYFGKPAKDLTMAEGAVLAGVIDNPEGENGRGSPFDPTVDDGRAHARFDEIRRALVDLQFVTAGEAGQKMAYPPKVLTAAQSRAGAVTLLGGMGRPEGLIVHHVLSEVAAITDPGTGRPVYEDTTPDGRKSFDRIRNGGLKIVTTIDPKAQEIAVREGGRGPGSGLDQQPAGLQAAVVAVEPGTGAVRAYYGGDNGAGNDYAGSYADPVLGDGNDSCCGGHPPAASFQLYALATGLMAGYTIDSGWNATTPQDFPASGRTAAGGNPVRDLPQLAPAASHCASGAATWCTLGESAVMSLNVPFFALAEKVGADKVIDTARAAGITGLWATVGGTAQRIDLTASAGKDVAPKYFQNEVALGQYPVTVLDQAGAAATFAARGLAARTHFLKEVWSGGRKTFAEIVQPRRIPGFTEAMADDLNAALQGVPAHYALRLHDARQVAGVTGSWPMGDTGAVSNAWMVGYTASDAANRSPGLAVAVWVGSKDKEQPLLDKAGRPIIGGGLPGQIWRDVLDDTLTALDAPKAAFAPEAGTGDKAVGTGVAPH